MCFFFFLSFGLDLNCHVRMRSFELCESALRADHMTTKPLPSPREHTCTLRRSHPKNQHWHARTFLSNTEVNISTKRINSVLRRRCSFVVCNAAPPPWSCRRADWISAPKGSENIPWACGTACQQKRRPRIQGWLLRQAVRNEAHERQRGLFLFFFLGREITRVLSQKYWI